MEDCLSELKNNQGVSNEPGSESLKLAGETNPFASLNKMLVESPELKSTFDFVMNILGDDVADEESTEVEYVEIDGHDYIIAKKIEIAGSTYLYLVNENDIMDYMIQKVIVEDGAEYIIGLNSEKEFELVQAYIQRDFLMQLKSKLKSDGEDKPDNH